MTRAQLIGQIRQKESFLCIGLDTDPEKIPAALRRTADPVFEFNKAIIDATHEVCIAYKPNIAFYESLGADGWRSLEKTLEYIPAGCLTIADAKRGDIGNSSEKYAAAFFDRLAFDAVTVSPYMGRDSVAPFLSRKGKWTILLALTSNAGASDFQLAGTTPLYASVLATASRWGTPENMMFVAGATQAAAFSAIRRMVPDHFLLVPGIGAQGGDLEAVARAGMNGDCGLIINSSRSILYASHGADFAEKAALQAGAMQQEMARLLKQFAPKP